MNDVRVGAIAVTESNEPNTPKGVLGVVVRKQHNTFIGMPTVTIVWGNDTYYDYSADDLGEELSFLNVRTARLDGLDFTLDHVISDAIRTRVFRELLADVKLSLEATPLQS